MSDQGNGHDYKEMIQRLERQLQEQIDEVKSDLPRIGLMEQYGIGLSSRVNSFSSDIISLKSTLYTFTAEMKRLALKAEEREAARDAFQEAQSQKMDEILTFVKSLKEKK